MTEWQLCSRIMADVPRLQKLRQKVALTQQELAERSGLHRNTIVAAEKGRRPRPSTIRRLARALKVKPEVIEWP